MSTRTVASGLRLGKLNRKPGAGLAVALAVLGLSATYALYTHSEDATARILEGRDTTELSHLAAETELGVTGRLRVLESLASWWLSQGQPLNPEKWSGDSRIFLDDATGLAEAEWVDRRGRVGWRVRPGGTPLDTSGSAMATPQCLIDALARPGVMVCGLSSGRVVAAVAARSEGQAVGYVVGVYDTSRMFDAALAGAPAAYDIAVLVDGREAFRRRAQGAATGPARSAPLRLSNAEWALAVGLPRERIAGVRFWIAAFGITLTLVLCLAARSAMISRQWARALSEAYDALLEAERGHSLALTEFETLLEVVPVGIAVAHDPECREIWTNPALARMLGVPRGRNISKTGEDAGSLPYRNLRDGVDVPAAELPMQRAARTAAPVWGEPLDVVRSDGTMFHTLSYSAPLFDEAGKVRGVVNACVDITSDKRTARERERLLERLRRSENLRSLALMAGGMAHDFNNLLTAILGHASLACDEAPPDSPVRAHLLECTRASERAAALTRKLLEYSGHAFQRVAELDISELAGEMENELRNVSPEAEWRFRLRQGLSRAHGDRDELREVIRQIVANAVDALGGAPGIIEIETGDCELSAARTARDFPDEDLPDSRYITLTVRDTGCGMSPDVLRRVFEPFFTTKFTGRGLGLPAAQGIVRAHRGAIRVESSPGSGTLVEIVLPAC